MKIGVLLVDDHDMVRAGLRSVLELRGDVEIVAEAGDGRTAIRLARELAPRLVVMDISMPDVNGVEATRQIVAAEGDVRVIILSMHGDRHSVAEALKAGASGYLLKNGAVKELGAAIDAALHGRVYLSSQVAGAMVDGYVRRPARRRGEEDDDGGGGDGAFDCLSPREGEVLRCLAEGKTNKEIAAQLFIGVKTVETHRAQLMDKLQIRTVAGLTKFAVRHGLTPLEGGG